MIHILHNGKQLLKVTHLGTEIKVRIVNNIVEQFIEIAKRFPDENLIWIKEDFAQQIDLDDLTANFKASHYMLSMGNIKNHFLYPAIGYVTDGPFVAVSQENIYPSWLMQDTAGIVAASTINQFNIGDYKNQSLEYFLSSVARIGQPQGLFCYHIPALSNSQDKYDHHSSSLFRFVGAHYKKIWVFLLLFLLYRYEKTFTFTSFVQGLFSTSLSTRLILKEQQKSTKSIALDYDVVIPTMGRKEYLKDVLLDLSKQQTLAQKVIIVEQNQDETSNSELDFLKVENWPFEIDHHFIHKTGACNARNLAISKTTASWILLFDDDNRFESDLLESMFHAIQLTGTKVLNVAYLQKGEKELQKTFKQWEFFGSGCSIAHRDVIEKCKFDMALEHGYGEDVDYGMQIRNSGYDVIYAPQIQILHLKAPVGGFRKPHSFPWKEDDVQPKPSPQIMYFRKNNYTHQQLLGYKMIQLIKSFGELGTKNPYRHYKKYQAAWSQSEKWTDQL